MSFFPPDPRNLHSMLEHDSRMREVQAVNSAAWPVAQQAPKIDQPPSDEVLAQRAAASIASKLRPYMGDYKAALSQARQIDDIAAALMMYLDPAPSAAFALSELDSTSSSGGGRVLADRHLDSVAAEYQRWRDGLRVVEQQLDARSVVETDSLRPKGVFAWAAERLSGPGSNGEAFVGSVVAGSSEVVALVFGRDAGIWNGARLAMLETGDMAWTLVTQSGGLELRAETVRSITDRDLRGVARRAGVPDAPSFPQ